MINMPTFTSPAPAGTRPATLALVAVSVLSPIGISIILPSMPSMQRAYETDYGTVQFTLSLYLVSIALSQIIVGPLSDRFGRRPVLLCGISVFIASSLAAVVAPTIESLIAIRVLQAAGGATGLVLGRAIIRDVYDRRKAASMIGYVTMAYALGPMVAPMIGGFLQDLFDWRAQFYFLAAVGCISLAVGWHWIGETNVRPTDRLNFGTMFGDFRSLLSDRLFVLFTLVSASTAGTYFSFLGGASYITENLLRLRPREFGVWLVLVSLGYSLGNFISGRYAERVGVRRMLSIGTVVTLAAVSSLFIGFWAGLESAGFLFSVMLIVACSNGMVLPSAMAGAISARPDIAGAAAGLTGALQMGAGAICSTIAGALIAGHPNGLPVFAIMTICGALSVVATLVVHRVLR